MSEGDGAASPAMSTPATGDTKATQKEHIRTTDFVFLPIPKRLRYCPERHVHFGLLLNTVFGLASTFGMASLASPISVP